MKCRQKIISFLTAAMAVMYLPSASADEAGTMILVQTDRIPEEYESRIISSYDPDDDEGMPSRSQLQLARVDMWVLTHDLFADLKVGKVTVEKVLKDLRNFAELAEADDYAFFDDDDVFYGYQQQSENRPLAYLLNSAISNLTTRAKQ